MRAEPKPSNSYSVLVSWINIGPQLNDAKDNIAHFLLNIPILVEILPKRQWKLSFTPGLFLRTHISQRNSFQFTGNETFEVTAIRELFPIIVIIVIIIITIIIIIIIRIIIIMIVMAIIRITKITKRNTNRQKLSLVKTAKAANGDPVKFMLWIFFCCSLFAAYRFILQTHWNPLYH